MWPDFREKASTVDDKEHEEKPSSIGSSAKLNSVERTAHDEG